MLLRLCEKHGVSSSSFKSDALALWQETKKQLSSNNNRCGVFDDDGVEFEIEEVNFWLFKLEEDLKQANRLLFFKPNNNNNSKIITPTKTNLSQTTHPTKSKASSS